MIKIMTRAGVFETNSSSSHSLTIDSSVLLANPLPKEIARSGIIELSVGDFGWEWYRYYTFKNKLAYLLADIMGFSDEGCTYDSRDGSLLDAHPRAESLCRFVKDFTGCDLVVHQERFSGVDHQSRGRSLALYDDEEKLKGLLLGAESFIETGNDNTPCGKTINTDRGPEAYYQKFYRTAAKNGMKLKLLINSHSLHEGPKFKLTSKQGSLLLEHEELSPLKWLAEHAVVTAVEWRAKDAGREDYMMPWYPAEDQDGLEGLAMHRLSRFELSFGFSPELSVSTKRVNTEEEHFEQMILTLVYPRTLNPAYQKVLAEFNKA